METDPYTHCPKYQSRGFATKLFNEQFVSIQPEEYIQFLAVNDEESNAIREYYMDLFQWDPNLLKSTRSLCAKLYLKGESQEIDRILTSFTQSYIKQNPVNVFCTKNFENIYIVLYSLILLNTSLHNAEVNKKSKISQSDYIRNTFTTFIQQDPKLSKKLSIKQRITIERELGNYYEDLSKNELHLKTNVDDKLARIQPITKDSSKGVATTDEKIPNSSSTDKIDDLNLSRQVSGSSIWSSDTNKRNSLSMKRMSSATSSISQFTITNGSRNNNRVGFTRALVSDQNQRFYQQGNSSMVSNGTYGTVRNRQSIRGINGSGLNGAAVNRSSRASIVSRESLATNNDDSMSVVSFESADLDKINLVDPQQQQQQVTQLENFNVDQFQDNFDLTLELQGSPYLKEGLLKLKILNNDQQDNNLPDSTISSGTSSVSTASSTSSRFFSFFSRSSRGNNSESSSLNATSNSVLNNKFVEYFVVVSKGEMNLYSFDPKVVKRHQQKLKKFKQKQQKNLINLDFLNDDDDISTFNDSTEDVGDGNWLKNAANVGNYNLCSAFSQLEKSSLYIKKTSGYIFTLTFPKTSKKPNKKFVFEAGTKEIALEFINTCNFWASKITAIPTFEESVSSIEYGWNDLDQLIGNKANFKKLKSIQKWEPLPQGLYLSTYNYDTSENHYNMMKQFIKTLNYYHNLKKLFKEFNELRIKFIKNFSSQASSSNFLRIQANYESKLLDYKFELKKYKNYLIILGFALQLRFDLEDEEKDREQLEIDLEKDSDNVEFSDTVNDTTVIASSKSSSDNSNDDVDEEDNDEESELSRLVKYEIRKLFIGLKDVGKIIPTFQTSKSISNLNELQSQIPNLTASDFNNSFSLVKSPKTYTLSNYKDNESPINQLLQSQKPKEIVHSFSHNTIKEEDEPEAN
ncbi:hypothetical protein CANTEDRAFT_129995 [Yamadazyma tenuis ATCC 10573]|uniref:SEC7 domain-containing protein n=1 Tax=Candida tenuis (strain ATCC 10573 / BCRC 21748 / CBS 615 / JCM 9827 / NBRC 10315 / NRRL Y-1498 / VKM Y-70) TaxID=590646 RepID=G3B0U3_CANTC|nr:uncharacterized protein CANTEDRAFT_129995 [Yamadazyma tenuis ATCC 10573]EGV64802.1 hypothetical protein CANTEDRAFT_129995 [Yamadazyma tenuis ATCC 10573]